jgi:hypothetical protein
MKARCICAHRHIPLCDLTLQGDSRQLGTLQIDRLGVGCHIDALHHVIWRDMMDHMSRMRREHQLAMRDFPMQPVDDDEYLTLTDRPKPGTLDLPEVGMVARSLK